MSRLAKLLVVWVIGLGVAYAILSILRHNHFQSGGFDLGIYDQAVWQYAKFLKPYNTIKASHIWGDHLTLTLPLLAPLFWLWDDVRILLIFQAFWLAFSSLAVFKLAQHRKLAATTALALTISYSFFYGLQQAVYFDFHPVILGVGLLVWLAYFLESNQKKLFGPTLILLLLTQENMGIALACLGLIYFWQKKYRLIAVKLIAGGLLWSLLASRLINRFASSGFQYWPQITFSPIKILTDFFNAEEKRLVWLYSLSWFGLLPLFSPGAMWAVFLDLGQYFVTGPGFSRMWSPFTHHRAILGVFLVLGAMEGLKLLKKQKIVTIGLIMVALGCQYFFHFPLNKLAKQAYWQQEPWMVDNQALLKMVPPDASVASQQNLVPHLSHRREIYLAWPRQIGNDWWLAFGGQPEYLVVDRRPGQWLTQILETNENFQAAIENMEKSGKITLKTNRGDACLYRIN